jgi:aspartate/glutamate racemase
VIIGCTEIELLMPPLTTPVHVFPTTRLHSESAVEPALG